MTRKPTAPDALPPQASGGGGGGGGGAGGGFLMMEYAGDLTIGAGVQIQAGGGGGGAGGNGGLLQAGSITYAAAQKKTPLQELTERTWAPWDPTDGCPECGGELEPTTRIIALSGLGKWNCLECSWYGPNENHPHPQEDR